MSFIAERRAAWSPPSVSDDGHWSTEGGRTGYISSSGQVVTEETALRLSAVWACYKVLTEGVSQMRIVLYERFKSQLGDARRRADGLELSSVLGLFPNDEQTAYEYVEQVQGYMLFRRYATSRIEWRGLRDVKNVTPIHPDRVRRVRTASGIRTEELQDDNITWKEIPRDQVFRVPGTPVLDYARESFGMAMALENYGAKSFGKGVRAAGFIAQDPSVSYDEESKKDIKARILEEHSGPEGANNVLWLPHGLKWNQVGMTNQQAEFASSRAFTVADVSRWFRVPPYMLSLLEEGTVSYASVTRQSMDFVVYSLMPWLRRWEQSISRDLIVDTDRFYAEFLTAEMLRGTTDERYAVYAVARQWGIMSVNEIRRLENMNPIPGGDDYRPVAMGDSGPPDEDSPAANLLGLLLDDTTDRISNRETSAVPKLLEKGDQLSEFWDNHASYVARALHISPQAAESYVERRRSAPTDEPDTDTLTALALERLHDSKPTATVHPTMDALAGLNQIIDRKHQVTA